LAVVDDAVQRRCRIGINLVHATVSSRVDCASREAYYLLD
jgi:hypothetical protein